MWSNMPRGTHWSADGFTGFIPMRRTPAMPELVPRWYLAVSMRSCLLRKLSVKPSNLRRNRFTFQHSLLYYNINQKEIPNEEEFYRFLPSPWLSVCSSGKHLREGSGQEGSSLGGSHEDR